MKVTESTSPNERFALLIEALGFTQVVLSQELGLSQGYISQLASGSRQVTTKILQNIAKKNLGINVGWVLTGDGEMFLKDSAVNNEAPGEPLEMLRVWMESFESRIKELEAEVKRMKVEKGE